MEREFLEDEVIIVNPDAEVAPGKLRSREKRRGRVHRQAASKNR